MLNTAEIVARIQDLMVHHKITAAAFVEKIGVQRSLVSHVLSEETSQVLISWPRLSMLS